MYIKRFWEDKEGLSEEVEFKQKHGSCFQEKKWLHEVEMESFWKKAWYRERESTVQWVLATAYSKGRGERWPREKNWADHQLPSGLCQEVCIS